MILFPDTERLWLLIHPEGGPDALEFRRRIAHRLETGDRLAIAEICDYETRRELLRTEAHRQLANLEALIAAHIYVPLDTATLREAASSWAKLHKDSGGDVDEAGIILATQARRHADDHMVLTEDHDALAPFCNAQDWWEV